MLTDIIVLLFTVLSSLAALTLHEFAHGYAAYRLGDNTAKSMGRLSLDPLKHLDPFGVLCMVLFHFGWAKPVPINPRNFDNPKRSFAITALAGPLINIILAFIGTFLYALSFKAAVSVGAELAQTIFAYAALLFRYFSLVNIGLGVFNLIPLPPFDGSRIAYALLPDRLYFKVMQYERKIYFGVIAWLLLGTNVYNLLIGIPAIGANPILSSIAMIFDLSGLINRAVAAIAGLLIDFFGLLIF